MPKSPHYQKKLFLPEILMQSSHCLTQGQNSYAVMRTNKIRQWKPNWPTRCAISCCQSWWGGDTCCFSTVIRAARLWMSLCGGEARRGKAWLQNDCRNSRAISPLSDNFPPTQLTSAIIRHKVKDDQEWFLHHGACRHLGSKFDVCQVTPICQHWSRVV